jgi:hypothetical protein
VSILTAVCRGCGRAAKLESRALGPLLGWDLTFAELPPLAGVSRARAEAGRPRDLVVVFTKGKVTIDLRVHGTHKRCADSALHSARSA